MLFNVKVFMLHLRCLPECTAIFGWVVHIMFYNLYCTCTVTFSHLQFYASITFLLRWWVTLQMYFHLEEPLVKLLLQIHCCVIYLLRQEGLSLLNLHQISIALEAWRLQLIWQAESWYIYQICRPLCCMLSLFIPFYSFKRDKWVSS